MELSDQNIVDLCRINPMIVPIPKISRCLQLLEGKEKSDLLKTISKRKPRNDHEREILLNLALHHRTGGLMMIDYLGGFDLSNPH